MTLPDTGLDSEQDHDFGSDGNPGLTFYESPVNLVAEETNEVPEFGTFLLPVCTTQARLLEMLSTIRAGAIARGLPPVGDYNIDIIKAIEDINNPENVICFEGVAMSCEDVADCIETNEAVQNALEQNLFNNGYAPSGNSATSTDVTMSAAQAANNLLPPGYSCEEAQMMATARAIVQKFHNFAQDFFEQTELLTNPIELGNVLSDGIPVADTLNNVGAFIDYVIETLQETYVASYNEAVEKEITCELYCAMRENCLLTYDIIINVYNQLAIVEYPAPSDTADFQAIVDWAIGLDMEVGTATVAAFHLLLALAMKFGSGQIFEMAGLVGLQSLIGQSMGQLDTTWVDCDCAPTQTPTDFWMIFQDGRIGIGNWIIGIGTHTANGIFNAANAGDGWAGVRINDFGASFQCVAFAVETQRRGATAAADDISRGSVYTGANNTGTENAMLIHTGINQNTNKVYSAARNTVTPVNGRSPRFLCTSDGTINATTNFVTIVRWVIYGNCNAGQVKPPQAVYVSAIPPIESLFPS